MSNEQLHHDIKGLLEIHGAMGVNQLSKELNVPLSTMQKYLDKQQNYFKKNNLRKWVLPEKLLNEHMSTITDNHTDIIENQISSMNMLMLTLKSQLDSTLVLMSTNNHKVAPVADLSRNNHSSINKLTEYATNMDKAIKMYKSNIPEEYLDLMLNLDTVDMVVYKGLNYMNSGDSAEITGILVGDVKELSESTINVLREHQK